jgi:hypothetical protein
MIVPRTQPERSVVVVLVVVVAVADGDHSGHGHGHGHDHVYGHDLLRLSRDLGYFRERDAGRPSDV